MMEEIKDKSIHHTALKLCDDLMHDTSYKFLYSQIQKLVASPNVKYEEFKESLTKQLKEAGLDSLLRNNVYHWVRSQNKDQNLSYDSFFKKAQLQWEKRIHKSMNSMCSELGIHMAKVRSQADREKLIEKWGELSNYDVDINKYRPVYSPKDFLEVLLNLKGPNHKRRSFEPSWDFSHVPLKVKDLNEFTFAQRILYSELAHGDPVMGINNATRYVAGNYAAFESDRLILGEKVVASNQAPVAQEYLKKGCPPCLRARLWTLILGSEIKENHVQHYEKLKNNVLQHDLVTDKLIIKDIHLTASNDDQYFVFEDVLHQILLCFSRDSEILEQMHSKPSYMQVVLKGKQSTPENMMVFPPSGIIPFHGFTMYAAPFCYLFDDSVSLYFTVRAFYLRYWYRLHRVCGHVQGIVSLCLLFERLLQTYDPVLWHHFKKIHVPPIRVVFKWIMRAFSGHLPPEQLLYLWDLILAYDSLEIIPLLSVVVLIFRRDNLLRVTTLANIEAVLADLSSVTVMSMLQMALTKEF